MAEKTTRALCPKLRALINLSKIPATIASMGPFEKLLLLNLVRLLAVLFSESSSSSSTSSTLASPTNIASPVH